MNEDQNKIVEAKQVTVEKLKDPTNPPWVRRACDDLINAADAVLGSGQNEKNVE